MRIIIKLAKNKNLLKFTIIDNGVGIEENVIGKLGKAFKTFNINNQNSNGIGLGLFITNNIIQL